MDGSRGIQHVNSRKWFKNYFYQKKNQTAGSYKEKVSKLILVQSKVEQENNLMSEAVNLSPGSAIYCFYKPGLLLWPSVASSLKWK